MYNLIKRDHNNSLLPMRSLQRQIDNLFSDFFDGVTPSMNSGMGKTFAPRVNISEDEKSYHIEAELAGLKKEDIKLQCDENNTLSIRAQRKEENKEDKKNYHRVERFSGTFYRSFQLPENVDRENIKAEMQDGVLHIDLQKTAKSSAKTTEIKIS